MTTGDAEIGIADVELSDISRIISLFSSYYKETDAVMRHGYLAWLYIENVFGAAKGVFVEAEGHLIGFMALIPVRIRHGQSTISAHYVVNVLVHPEHQGKNLFVRMISAAIDYSKKNNAALIGHPNNQALKFWQRKRMKFQEELRPTLLLPWWNGGTRKLSRIRDDRQLAEYFEEFGGNVNNDKGAAVDVSLEYIKWRFVSHPVNKYILIAARMRDGGSMLQIVRKLSMGRHMFMDQFANTAHESVPAGGLPVVTAVFRPSSEVGSFAHGEIALPLRKRIPYFVSTFDMVPEGAIVSMTGLSASDF